MHQLKVKARQAFCFVEEGDAQGKVVITGQQNDKS